MPARNTRIPPFAIPEILGIVNVTRDSFSDGGKHLSFDAALAQARKLRADGATMIDLGAQSTHPDAAPVPTQMQIDRLVPLILALRKEQICVSVDANEATVMSAAIAAGADCINDVSGFRDAASVEAVAGAVCRLILMHAVGDGSRAAREQIDPRGILDRVCAFFDERLTALERAGIATDRLILDPGLGFFLGNSAESSCRVLAALPALRARFGLPLLISASRKSFIAALTSNAGNQPPPQERGPGTLAAELWAASRGVEYIRTHEVRPLRDALRVWQALHEAQS